MFVIAAFVLNYFCAILILFFHLLTVSAWVDLILRAPQKMITPPKFQLMMGYKNMWSKFVYLVYSLRYCCLFTFNVKNRVAQKWSKWHFFNSIFHWEVTGSVFGPFKTQNTILTKMPNFCRHNSLIKKGYFILLDLPKSMIFHKNRITFMRFCDPRYFVLIKLISPCYPNR